MPDTAQARMPAVAAPPAAGWRSLVADWSSDQRAFKGASWGKAMMWIFLLSDTFVFGCFLLSYMTVRMSTVEPWPNPSEVFALEIGGAHLPLILIAIMTFVGAFALMFWVNPQLAVIVALIVPAMLRKAGG